LPDGVTAARLTLDQLVLVRIQVRQLLIFPAKLAGVRSIASRLESFYPSSYMVEGLSKEE
jgi:hypothetical protein